MCLECFSTGLFLPYGFDGGSFMLGIPRHETVKIESGPVGARADKVLEDFFDGLIVPGSPKTVQVVEDLTDGWREPETN